MTSIEWTRGDDGSPGSTWNPVRGCSRVSEGCRNCYAESFAARFGEVKGHPFEGFARMVREASTREPLDPSIGHDGTVYRADGWASFGRTRNVSQGWSNRPGRRAEDGPPSRKTRWVRTP